MAAATIDRKSTRLNSSHGYISYAVFCLKKKKIVHHVNVVDQLLARLELLQLHQLLRLAVSARHPGVGHERTFHVVANGHPACDPNRGYQPVVSISDRVPVYRT